METHHSPEYRVSDDDIQRALPSYLAAMGSSGTVDHPQRVIKAVLTAVLPKFLERLADEIYNDCWDPDGGGWLSCEQVIDVIREKAKGK
jgi:hypothetical protein